MTAWLENALSRATELNDWLSDSRSQSLAQLKEARWPTRKVEAWKYTSVKPLERGEFNPAASGSMTDTAIHDLNAIDLVFVNGQFDAAQSSKELPAGLTIDTLAKAPSDVQAWAKDSFNSVKPARHIFGLANDVLAQDGALISVAQGVVIEQPIRIVQLITDGAETHTRTLVKIADNAKLTIVEHYPNTAQSSFNTGVVEYDIAREAELEHYRFALQVGKNISVGGNHFKLSDKSQLNSTLIGFGSDLSRVDVDIIHRGEHANAKFNAVYLLDGSEVFDLHATVEHEMPNCVTEENIRGIVAGSSKAIFNGRIHIHRDAQKTLAELNNRNLLMSNKAEINTKPELEIYADDVRCAHGATIAEIDNQSLYYLRSRGISELDAQIMLNFGFINELVDQMPNEVLAEWLRPQLRERFAQMKLERMKAS